MSVTSKISELSRGLCGSIAYEAIHGRSDLCPNLYPLPGRRAGTSRNWAVILEMQPLAQYCARGVSFELTDRGCVDSVITLTPRRAPSSRVLTPSQKKSPRPLRLFPLPPAACGAPGE